jgi:uncharacterized membrane protein YgcG
MGKTNLVVLSMISLVALLAIFSIGIVDAKVIISGTVYDASSNYAGGITVTVNCDSETPQNYISKVSDGTYAVIFMSTNYCTIYNASVESPYSANAIDNPDGSASPVITILGDNPQIVSQGTLYVDAGATASDDVDGDLTSDISTSGIVDTNTLGSYNIIYSATDSDENTATATRVVNVVDTTAPVVTLVSPENATSTLSSGVTFTYNVTDANDVSSCDLIIDGTVDQTSITPIVKDTSLNFGKSLANAVYSWIISCKDASGNVGNSSTNSLTVNYTAPSSSSSSGGGGSSSSGGSICTTTWTCSEWSECSGNTQSRTCSYGLNFCKPQNSKPAETQSCTVPLATGNTTITNQTTTPSTSFLTGAVTGVGNFLKSGLGIGIITGFLIIGGSVIFFAVKRKKKDKKEAK